MPKLLQKPAPIANEEVDINPQSPVFVEVANNGEQKLMAHEIKNFGCIVISLNAMCFIKDVAIISNPDRTYKLGRR